MKNQFKVFIASALLFFNSAGFAAEILVQSGDPGTSSVGSWSPATAATMPLNGNPGMYAIVGGSADNYTFTATILEDNTYTVETWNTCYSPRSHSVLHELSYPGGLSTFVLDQDCNTDPFVGQWRTLGAYSFMAGDTVALTIGDQGSNNSYIGATAMRLTYEATANPDPDPQPEPEPEPQPSQSAMFDFDCALIPIDGLLTYNPEANPNVGAFCGKYSARITDNSNNRTLFYNGDQGRLDGLVVSIPFEAILYNVGIAPLDNQEAAHAHSSDAYMFAGLHVHHPDFNNVNSAHLVVGQRGGVQNTVEGKRTKDGYSWADDVGSVLPDGRADLRVTVDAQGALRAFYRLPGASAWIEYALPGEPPSFGTSGNVIVGIITYAFYSAGLPFQGVADSFEIITVE